MGAHWPHWKVKSSLWALAVSKGGSICLWYLHVCSIHWYFLISSYYLTVLNGCSLTTLKSIEFTQCSGSFEWEVHQPLVSTCFLYALVFPYIFLLFDCFKWVLIDCIERCRVHSVLWQFQMGGPSAFGIYMFSLCTGISLYFPIIWLFWMGAHWRHWTAQSSLSALAVSNGGSISLWYLHVFSMHWYFLISSYYLTVLNGHSLTALKGVEFTQCSGSFKWGVHQPLVSTCFLYALVFPYIFLLFDCFEWVLIGDIGQHRVHSVLWQFQMGGGGIIGRGIIVSLSALVYPDIFLLVDHFKWVLIGSIGQCRVDSVLWQFQMGGGDNCLFICTGISLYIPISWPFWRM